MSWQRQDTAMYSKHVPMEHRQYVVCYNTERLWRAYTMHLNRRKKNND